MSEQTTQEQIVEMDINLLRTFKDHPFKVNAIVMVKDWNNDNIYVAFIGYIWYCLFRELSVRCIDKIPVFSAKEK